MKTKYGLDFTILPADELNKFEGYDRCVAECHVANYGSIIVDTTYQQPIDNENDLEEIYNLIKV